MSLVELEKISTEYDGPIEVYYFGVLDRIKNNRTALENEILILRYRNQHKGDQELDKLLEIVASNSEIAANIKKYFDRVFPVGTLISCDYKYEGQVFEDVPHGSGVIRYDNGDVYIGSFKSGQRHGKGELTFKNGRGFYKGQFENDYISGYGKFDYGDLFPKIRNDYYIGQFKDGKKHGKGKYYYSCGDTFEGIFENDKNNSVYSGEFFQGAKHGPGTLKDITTGKIQHQSWENGWQTQLPHESKQPVKVFPEADESEKKTAL